MVKVFIDGSEGTTGLRIADRLSARDEISLIPIDPKYRKDPEAVKECISQADAVFLCLPDGAAREAAALAEGNDHVVIIDASTAHRTAPGWAYGFPELGASFRKGIEEGKRIANPGCHASGMIALLYPLRQAGVLPPDFPVGVTSITGFSGGGKKMISQYNGAERPLDFDAPRPYALVQKHKHLPEVTKVCALSEPPVFTPIVAPFYSGMDVMIPLFPQYFAKGAALEEVREMYRKHYEGSAAVYVRDDEPSYISALEMSGYDDMEIIVTGNDERMVVHAVFDNLGKGASGAAVQCLNLAMGLPETAGLRMHQK